ncbi:MAG: hypothetical protein FWD63_08035, partial [Propionibacteriaceae bacterium]|nr:hypothetical protein [Propionibacteriaceae bacterium]
MKKFLATAVSVVLAASLTWTSLTIVPSHADPGSPSDPPLPASVDLTQYSVPALTQGSVYACETWSVAYTLMGWYANKNGGNSQAFAPMYLFSQTGNTSMGLPEPILLGQGVDTQDDYPQGNYDYVTQPTPAQVANAANFRFTGFATLFDDEYGTNTTKRTAIETALASGTPVVFGILDRDGIKYYHPTSLDIADTDYGSPYPDGGHSVVAMGYDSNGVLIQNSWGHTWGVNGFGRVSWDVVEHDVSDAYVATGFSMAPTTPALTVTAPVTSVSSRHTAIPLQITSNTEWQVVSEPSWTNVNPSSGFGTLAASDDQGTVDISVLQNDSSDPRTGTVTFTTTKGSPAAVANVTITQAGATSTPVDTPTLTLGQASWNAGQGSASSVSVAVTSNTSWNVSTSDPWLYTAVQSGVGNDSVQIFASVNMTDSDRQGTVTFTSGSITRTVAVIQPMMPTLTISQSAGGTFRVPASSVWFAPSAAVWSASVPLFSNTSWTAYSDSPWLTTTPPAGSSRGSLNMSASENTSPGARTATVTVTTTSGAPQLTRTIKVIQPGTAQTATLALPMTTWWVPTAAATQATTNVTSNADWTVASSASWLTATPDPTDGTVAMATQANTSTASRTATLTFTSTTGSPAATATMTVTQPGVTSPLLTLDRDTWAPPSPQDQTVDMAVTSNQSWKVESSDSWLTPSSTVGSGSQSVMLTAHANLFRTPRTATLTFTTTLGTPILTQTVTVTQPAAQVDPQLSTDTDTWAVPSADAATTTLNVSSTGSWMAIPSDHSWLSLTSPNGAGSKPVTVSAQPNTSTTPRTATITFSSTGESPAATQVVTVTQPGIPNTLSIDQTSLQRPAITYAPATVNVDTNTTWSVTSDSSWLSVSRSSLSSIQVAVTGNYLLDRTGTITVSTIVGSPTLTRTITVTQAGNGLTLDQRGWEAPAAADSITLHVTSKANWSVSSNSSWLTVSPTSGSGNGIVTVSVAANLSAASGNLGYLTFVTSGDPAATLNFPVLQDRTDPVLTVGSDSWPVPSNTANSTTIPVTSNLGWTATSSDTSWLTVSPYGLTYNNGSLYLLAQANPSASPRTATITVSSATKSGYPPATATITVTQPGAVPASTLSVSNDKWPVPSANSASTTINVSSNTTWTTKSSDTWLTV